MKSGQLAFDPSIRSRWTNEELDHFRTQMDPLADKTAKALLHGHNVRGVMKILHLMAQNDSSVDLEVDGFQLPQPLKDYFDDLSHFQFTEGEKEILDEASDFFELYGPIITFTLAVRSLLKQYAATKATNVLRMTTLLTEYTDRRVTETFQFVLDVMQKKWYEPGNRGIRSIQKLRLIHALIRCRIEHGQTDEKEGKWNPDWGMPINQEDMIFANQTFSVEVLEGLQEARVPLNRRQVDVYFQGWQLIGRALGVNPSLEASSYEEGRALQQQIYARQFTLPNHNGPPLAAALMKWLKEVFPFHVTEKSMMTFVKFINGAENYDILEKNLKLNLGHSHDNFFWHVSQILGSIGEKGLELDVVISKMGVKDLKAGHFQQPIAMIILEDICNRFLRGIFMRKRGSKSTSFQIEDALANKWGLPGSEGIPEPDIPILHDLPKKKHPVIAALYNVFTWLMDLWIKVKDFFT